MSNSILLPYDIVEAAVQQVVECEGESPITIELSTLLRLAEANEQPISISGDAAAVLESYM